MSAEPFTLRELVWMSDGRRKHEWGIASSLMAHIHNQNPYQKRPANPSQFHPYAKQEQERVEISFDDFLAIQSKAFGKG